MRLVIQCSVCGTIWTVGTAVCGTCRASGIQNLRLLFECLTCFRLGLNPSCESCTKGDLKEPDHSLDDLPIAELDEEEVRREDGTIPSTAVKESEESHADG
jgi:hypothetical protein